MSRVYESLRQSEEEVRAKQKSLQGTADAGEGRAGFLARLEDEKETGSPSGEHPQEADQTSASELVQQVAALAARLDASRGELEALIATAQRVREGWEAEVRDSQQRMQESNLEALRAAAAKVKAEVLERAVSLSRCAVDQAMRRLEEKANSTLEEFTQTATSRLTAHTSECVAQSSRQIEALRTSETDRSEAEIKRVATQAAAEFDARLKAMAEEIAAGFQQEVRRSLEQFTSDLLSRRDAAWLEKVEATEQSLEEGLRNSRQEIQSELANACGKLQSAFDERMEAASQALAARVETSIEALNQASDQALARLHAAREKIEAEMKVVVEKQARETVQELSNSACLGMQNKLGEMMGRFRNELNEMLRGFEQKASQQLQEAASRQAESSGQQVRQLCEEALGRFRGELAASGKQVVEQTEKHMVSARALVDSLARQVGDNVDRYRADLMRAVGELRESAARELGANFQAVLEEQREAVRRHLLDETRSMAQEVMAEIQQKCEEAGQHASEAVHKQVGQAAMALKDWADQACGRLDASYQKALEGLEKSITDLSRVAVEQQRQSLSLLVDDLRARMVQAAQVLKGPTELASTSDVHPARPSVEEARPVDEDVRKQLHDAVEDFVKRALEGVKHRKPRS